MPKVDLNGPDGNIFAIMAMTKNIMKSSGRGDEWLNVQLKMMSGDYQNALDIAQEATNHAFEFVK